MENIFSALGRKCIFSQGHKWNFGLVGQKFLCGPVRKTISDWPETIFPEKQSIKSAESAVYFVFPEILFPEASLK